MSACTTVVMELMYEVHKQMVTTWALTRVKAFKSTGPTLMIKGLRTWPCRSPSARPIAPQSRLRRV